MSKLLLVDFYDSFTYTIANYFLCLGMDVRVSKHDQLGAIQNLQQFSYIVLSPGPGHPTQYPQALAFVQQHHQSFPFLGICLGHQLIIQALGGEIITAPKIMHGKLSTIEHTQQGLFQGLEQNFTVMRYHSLMANNRKIPAKLSMEAWTKDLEQTVMMGCKHRDFPIYGVQYHPESILTTHGLHICKNFLALL